MRQSGVLNEIERTLFTRVSGRGGSTGVGARPCQAEAARRLGIAKGTLSNWVVAAKGGKDTSAIPGARSVAELEAEVARLRKALAQANMERDIIKKAAAYFAQESLPSTRG